MGWNETVSPPGCLGISRGSARLGIAYASVAAAQLVSGPRLGKGAEDCQPSRPLKSCRLASAQAELVPRNGVTPVEQAGEPDLRPQGCREVGPPGGQALDLEEWSVATDSAGLWQTLRGLRSLGSGSGLPRFYPVQWGVTRATGSLLSSSVGLLGYVLGDNSALGL